MVVWLSFLFWLTFVAYICGFSILAVNLACSAIKNKDLLDFGAFFYCLIVALFSITGLSFWFDSAGFLLARTLIP